MQALEPNISKLGFGLMRLPRLEDGAIDVELVKKMVDEYIAAGGTYFDTARMYGGSEAAIGEALVARYPRESFYLATKNAAWADKKNAEEARHDFDISLEQTGAGYFDFYLIHNTGSTRTAAFDKFDMWTFVRELKEQGKVRHIGFSHHDNAEVLEKIIEAHPEMEFVQLQVNYADWEGGNVQSRKCVEVARKHGLPVIVMEPVHGGMLANPPEAVAELLRAAAPEASCASWAIRFAMDVEGVMVVLSGMSNLEQMRDNIATWKAFEPLSDADHAVLAQAQQKLAELIDNPCTSCHYCMKNCPAKINISGVMDSLNRAALFGVDGGRFHYMFETAPGQRASDCFHCYQCEDACPQGIRVVEKLEQAAELFGE